MSAPLGCAVLRAGSGEKFHPDFSLSAGVASLDTALTGATGSVLLLIATFFPLCAAIFASLDFGSLLTRGGGVSTRAPFCPGLAPSLASCPVLATSAIRRGGDLPDLGRSSVSDPSESDVSDPVSEEDESDEEEDASY